MYKIMLADDEGIVIDALKFIIQKNFGDSCMIEAAKTGRSVIELAERFRPDIALMDIQMPGINGIEAMREIQANNSNIIFIVISAYDKFDYAKEAIHLGVLEYVNKPIEQGKVVALLKKAMGMVDAQREKRSNDLLIKEKMEIVVPVIENGLIYSVLFQDNYAEDAENFKHLLGLDKDYGFMMILECGDAGEKGQFTNPVGSSVRVQSHYQELRGIVKEYFPESVIGSVMANKIIILIPSEAEETATEYDGRIELIEQTRKMVRNMRQKLDAAFRVGIGAIVPLERIGESYAEALRSIRYAQGSVVHVKDLPILCDYEKDYPLETEKRLYDKIENGDINGAVLEAHKFFNWMQEKYSDMIDDVRLKVLEFVLQAEKIAYESGGMKYVFTARHEYLSSLLNMNSYDELRSWLVGKVSEVCSNIESKKEESSLGIIEMAKEFMQEHYSDELSLDEVSKIVNISPYYFSKLFKEETGINFIDFLTEIRMEHAKQLLRESDHSMKEICAEVGYSDPNYFSRTFKKNVGVTPTEYKEGKQIHEG